MSTLDNSKMYEQPSLLSCPFCGGKAKMWSHEGLEEFDPNIEYEWGVSFNAGCGSSQGGLKPNCQIQPSTQGWLTPDIAAKHWNNRQETPS